MVKSKQRGEVGSRNIIMDEACRFFGRRYILFSDYNTAAVIEANTNYKYFLKTLKTTQDSDTEHPASSIIH